MSIINHVTLQKIVAHDFRYVPRRMISVPLKIYKLREMSYRVGDSTRL